MLNSLRRQVYGTFILDWIIFEDCVIITREVLDVCRKVKKIMCCMVAVIIFFAGVCFECEKADSHFSYQQTDGHNLPLLQEQTVLTDVEMMESENIGAKMTSMTTQIANHGIYIRRAFRVVMEAVPVMNVFAALFFGFYRTTRIHFVTQKYSHGVVLNYIHNADGEK